MKTKLFFLFLLSFVFYLCEAQVPQGFNYQAIARDGSGNPILNTTLPVRITIQSDSLGGTIFWQELQSSVTSNSFGLINLVLGKGVKQTGTAATFSAIDWKVTPKFIMTEIYYSLDWKNMGSSRLWSVPYSMIAGDLAGSVKKLAVTGTTSALDEALFEVKNKNGQTIFAVYNEGVRIYVDDGAKGTKGGFAVGGFDMTKATKREYLVVSDDSIRMYLDSNPLTKGKKGGFAVGGFDMTKGTIQNYLDVSDDSIRMYIDDNGKGTKGGFAVGGFDMTKGVNTKYLNVTHDSTRIFAADTVKGFAINQGVDNSEIMSINRSNTSIGHESGLALKSYSGTIGIYNTFLGYQSGKNNTTGRSNNFIGYQAGLQNNGTCNIFIGKQSGMNNNIGGFNIFMGNQTGLNNNDGTFNTFIGYWSGKNNIGGDGNIFLGFQAGFENTEGNNNTFIGYNAGHQNTSASNNIYVGNGAGYSNSSGYNNLYLGYTAGRQGTTGHDNVFIGYKAGFIEPNNNRLYIANGGLPCPPLIYGDFARQQVTINGDSLNNSTYTFYVNGSAGGTTSWDVISDERLKTDIQSIDNPLDKVRSLRGVNFYWKDKLKMGDGMQMGFIAQEANEVVPEVVGKNGDYYNMQYAPITALLVEGMKEQQKQIESQNEKIERLEKLVEKLMEEK
jgi:hypothetical protein